MPLDAAVANLLMRNPYLYRQGKTSVTDALLRGMTLETPHARFYLASRAQLIA